jgi:hypothetical protein
MTGSYFAIISGVTACVTEVVPLIGIRDYSIRPAHCSPALQARLWGRSETIWHAARSTACQSNFREPDYSECRPEGGKSTLKPAMKFSFNDGKPNASSYRWFKKLFSRP